MKNKAIFFDRDGILIKEIYKKRLGEPKSINKIKDIKFKKGINDIAKYYKKKFLLIMVTNQPDVKRKKISIKKVNRINDIISNKLNLDDVYTCFCDNDKCKFRKPNNGSVIKAKKKWNINLKKSYFIGDRWKDIITGNKSKCITILLERPYSKKKLCKPNFSINDLKELYKIILI